MWHEDASQSFRCLRRRPGERSSRPAISDLALPAPTCGIGSSRGIVAAAARERMEQYGITEKEVRSVLETSDEEGAAAWGGASVTPPHSVGARPCCQEATEEVRLLVPVHTPCPLRRALVYIAFLIYRPNQEAVPALREAVYVLGRGALVVGSSVQAALEGRLGVGGGELEVGCGLLVRPEGPESLVVSGERALPVERVSAERLSNSCIHDSGLHLPDTSVNKGKKKSRGLYAPAR